MSRDEVRNRGRGRFRASFRCVDEAVGPGGRSDPAPVSAAPGDPTRAGRPGPVHVDARRATARWVGHDCGAAPTCRAGQPRLPAGHSSAAAVGLLSTRNCSQRAASSSSPIAAAAGPARAGPAGSRGWARAPTAPGRGPSSRCGAARPAPGGSRCGRRRTPSTGRPSARAASASGAQARHEVGCAAATSRGRRAGGQRLPRPGSSGSNVGGVSPSRFWCVMPPILARSPPRRNDHGSVIVGGRPR